MKHDLPNFQTYGNYSSSNYGAHALVFSVGGIDVYFSYKIPVAFRFGGTLTVRENEWGPTTGKHLNAIHPDKKRRVSGETFERMLSEAVTANEARRTA